MARYVHKFCGRCGIARYEARSERCGERDGDAWYGEHIWTFADDDGIIQTLDLQARKRARSTVAARAPNEERDD